MNKPKLVLVGGGGHCKVIIDALRLTGKYQIAGIVDNKIRAGELLGVKFIGGDDDLAAIYKQGCRYAFVSVGSVGACGPRQRLARQLDRIGFELPVIVHPSAVVSAGAELGAGTFVGPGAVIAPGCRIGRNVIVNTRASADHDCRLGDFVHLAPGATLSGGVEIGAKTHIGTGSAVIEYLTIGGDAIIGAGSVVVTDIPAKRKAFGNPCRVKGRR